ncbi:hypothetical protein [Arthrobacter sp. MYb227]|uniref:hypothetical protein n=1 Tax=Arthrobacter sp. MYb227 TaxID=1848601 RepID=UPI0015E3EB39|nr:hypothetical protein [Arthrobacter sp. MYb227]
MSPNMPASTRVRTENPRRLAELSSPCSKVFVARRSALVIVIIPVIIIIIVVVI